MGTLLVFMLWIGCGIGIEGLIKRVRRQKRRQRQQRTSAGNIPGRSGRQKAEDWEYSMSA